MKKLLLSIIIILSIFTLFSCQVTEAENNNAKAIDLDNANNAEAEIIAPEASSEEEKDEEANDNDAQASKEKDAMMVAKDGNEELNNDSEENKNQGSSEFVLKAIVKKVENDRIEAEVIESDYAFGIYWILTPNTTVYYNDNGSIITRQNIKVGDTVEISYSGQTMLSYPPQVVAYSIKLAK